MANTTVYTLDLDTSKLVSKYRSAISDMEKAGVSTDITKGLAASLDKLEGEYKKLAAAGAAGFTNSKEIEVFNRKIEKLMGSFRGFEQSLGGVSGQIGEVSKASEKARQKLENAFVKLGFKDAAKQMNDVANATNKEAELSKIVEQEIQKRATAVEALKKRYEEAANAANKAAQSASGAGLSANATAKSGDKATWTSGKNKPDDSTRKAIVAQAEGIAKAAASAEEAWRKFQDYISANNEEVAKSFNSVALSGGQVEAQIKAMYESYQSAAPALKEAEQAQAELNAATQSFNQIATTTKDGAVAPLKSAMKDLNDATGEVEKSQQQTGTVMQNEKTNAEQLANAERNVAAAVQGAAGAAEQERSSLSQMGQSLSETAKRAEETSSSFEQLKNRVLSFFSVTSMFTALRNQIKATYNDVKNLDKSFASIAMVTDNTVQGMWESYNNYADMASELGQKTNDVIQASALFYQQGLNQAEALSLTTDTMKLATLAGNDYQTATQEMTSALRGFKMEMDEGSHVTDVYSELAAHAAASVDDIAQAMSRTASIANSAGMSFENTSAFLTQMIETTQESAENIGTSLKTIIARFTELKENIAGTADSEFEDLDYNKVDKALKSVGVSLKDTNGQFRDLDDVFLDLSAKWDTLDRNTQRYVATIAAGSRQQSRFIAMMDNYDRTVELMELAGDAEGKADEQFEKYADTMEYKLNQLSTTWEQFRVNLLNSDMFKGLIDGVNEFVSRINAIDFSKFSGKLNLINFGVMIVGLKNFIKIFITNITSLVQTVKKLGAKIGEGLLTGIKGRVAKNKTLNKIFQIDPKLNLKVLEQDVQTAEQKLIAAQKKYNQITQVKTTLTVDPSGFANADAYFDALIEDANLSDEAIMEIQQQLVALGEGNYQTGFEALISQEENATAAAEEYQAKLDALKREQDEQEKSANRAAAASQLASAALSAGVTAIAGYTSGLMTGKEALASFGTAVGSVVVQLALQKVATLAVAAVEAALPALKAAVTAANSAEAGSWFAVFIGEVMATEGAAAWVGIILIAIAAIALLAVGVVALVKLFSELAKTESESEKHTKALAEATEAAAGAQERMNSAKDSAKSMKDEVKNARALKDEWDELSEIQSRGNLTEEQQGRMKELAGEIADSYPEIVKYYNEETGQLEIQNDLWEKKLKYQEGAADAQQDIADRAAEAYYNAEMARVEAEKAVNKDKIGAGRKDFATGYKDVEADGESVPVATQGDLFSGMKYAVSQKKNEGDKGGESYKEFAMDFAESNGLDMESIIGVINTVSEDAYYDIATMTNDQWGAVVEKIAGGEDDVKNAFEAAARDIDQAADEETQYYNDLIVSERAQALINDAADQGEELSFDTAKVIQSAIAQDVDEGEYEDIFEQLIPGKTWDELDENLRKELKSAGYDKDSFDELDLNDDEVAKRVAQNHIQAQKSAAAKKKGGEVLTELNDAGAIDAMNDLASNYSKMTLEEMRDVYEQALGGISDSDIDDSEKEQLRHELWQNYIEYVQSLKNSKAKVANYLGMGTDLTSFSNWDITQLDVFNGKLKEIKDTYGDLAAQDYGNQVLNFAEKNSLDPDQINTIMSTDWSQITAENGEEFKNQIVQQWTEGGIAGADALYDQLRNEAEEMGMIDLTISTEGLEEYEEKLDGLIDKVQSLGDDIVSAVEDLAEAGEISFDNFNSLADSMSDLELDIYEYVNIDDNGKITASQEQLEELYKAQLEAQHKQLKVQIDENNAKIAELDVTLQNLKLQRNQIENAEDSIELTATQYDESYEWMLVMQEVAEAYASISGNHYEKTEIGKYTIDLSGSNKDDLLKAIDSQILATTTQMENLQDATDSLWSRYDNDDLWNKAAIRDFNNSIADATGEVNSLEDAEKKLADATDNLTEAQQNYADQLEVVAEKQEALNEKLKAYNDLLYGSDNRKSTLDYLYNYDEAINSFNNEISRAQDLLSDTTSIEGATVALERYGDATHNLIAEETAKQEVLKAGLSNIEDMIMNGGTSYQNKETGETIGVNFGDYVKIDERTGKAVLDQRLLNEAQFGDDWKDYLEEQVSNYNKYSENLLTSEDNVRKAEKAMEDLRKSALKSYAAMETEIAEALKEQYQNEVDALKEKYDSMKEADDDYLSALEDAIDKQRKLRDRENAWEDLAEQEKKLSLMQRDTSGANQVEVAKLEDEVSQTREEMLDEAIDNVIESLSDLYESQSELRDTEIELKEALLDNTLYWNEQAEGLAGSFEGAEEYAAFLSSLSEEYSMMTLAQQQDKLNEYGSTFTEASTYMAMQAMDSASETGDYVVDVTNVSGEEVATIVTNTAQTFTDEVTRSYNETTEAFNADLESAEQEIADARDALQEAINKLGEYAAAAQAAADAYALAKQEYEDFQNAIGNPVSSEEPTEGLPPSIIDKIETGLNGNVYLTQEQIDQIQSAGYFVGRLGDENGASYRVFENESDRNSWVDRGAASVYGKARKYASGGLVDYTGPAWVDGTLDRPEAFLNAEDTQRIGEAARILADIPWMDRDTENSTVVTNNGGDVTVEINLNIDHISSETDIDEMLERVKQEIVDVAHPAGTNTILQQQL